MFTLRGSRHARRCRTPNRGTRREGALRSNTLFLRHGVLWLRHDVLLLRREPLGHRGALRCRHRTFGCCSRTSLRHEPLGGGAVLRSRRMFRNEALLRCSGVRWRNRMLGRRCVLRNEALLGRCCMLRRSGVNSAGVRDLHRRMKGFMRRRCAIHRMCRRDYVSGQFYDGWFADHDSV